MADNVICVHLYGDGSRNSRLRAEYIRCDRAKECSAHKNGECFCVTTPFGVRCGIGNVNCVDGGTKSSKAYRRVWDEAKAHEAYAKLKHPSHRMITRIGDDAFLTLNYIWLEAKENGDISCQNPHIGTNRLIVNRKMLTPENIKRICDFRPQAIMGGTIRDYQAKTVPLFLHQMRELFPDEYEAFRNAYPDFTIVEPNWIGRRAKLATCNRTIEVKDINGNVFRFDGDYLVCDCYRSAFAPFNAKNAEIRIKVSDEMEVKITDNKQVTPETVFV